MREKAGAPIAVRRARPYALALLLVGALVWASGLDGVFLYDDYDSITLNPHIRTLSPLSEAMSRPLADAGETVSTRPLLSLTFAADYALHGLDVTGYHVGNIAIHLACTLLLFVFLRATLLLERIPARVRGRADGLAFAIALLWLVHPLQTASVTYIVQRAESLGAFFILLALYAGYRAATAGPAALAWSAVAVAACWLGAAAKETIAAAPLLVLVYHATFLDGSYRAALAKRWPLYAAMASSGALLWMLLSSDTGELVESGAGYALTQPAAVLRYLRLALWPHPLAMSYDWPVPTVFPVVPALIVGTLLAATVAGVAQRRWWGFAGACFFGILAPSSSFFGLTQRIMEHRMYLPLAPAIATLVLGANAALDRARSASRAAASTAAERAGMALLAGATLALACATIARNRDYADEVRFWRENVAAQPRDSIAHLQLGRAYLRTDAVADARASFEEAIRLSPPFAPIHNDLARALIAEGELDAAQRELDRALALDPGLAVAHNNAGIVAERRGRLDAAATSYRRALELDPALAIARDNLTRVTRAAGAASPADSAAAASAATLQRGAQLEREGRVADAEAAYSSAVAADPRNVEAANALATLLARQGRDADAIARFESVLALEPLNLDALRNLGALHAMRGRDDQALAYLERAARADRSALRVGFNLGLLYEKRGDLVHASASFERETKLDPGFAAAHAALARTLERQGDRARAAAHYATALRLQPDLAEAREGLQRLGGSSAGGS